MASQDDLLFHLEIPGGAGEQERTQARLSGHSSRSHIDLHVQEPTQVTLGKVKKDDFEILHLIGQGGYGKVGPRQIPRELSFLLLNVFVSSSPSLNPFFRFANFWQI